MRKCVNVTVKTLKRALKKAGLKTTGKKAVLTRRVTMARLKLKGGSIDAFDPYGIIGGDEEDPCNPNFKGYHPPTTPQLEPMSLCRDNMLTTMTRVERRAAVGRPRLPGSSSERPG
jgi:hypothetical protein